MDFFVFTANNYKEELCTDAMTKLLNCCEKWKTKSNCCLGFLEEDAKGNIIVTAKKSSTECNM